MTAQHTPGPWRFNPGKPQVLAPKQHHMTAISYWRDVASVEPMKAAAPRGGCDPESQANGHLIAAAPEMYEALRLVVEHHEIRQIRRLIGDRVVIPFKALDNARALLARIHNPKENHMLPHEEAAYRAGRELIGSPGRFDGATIPPATRPKMTPEWARDVIGDHGLECGCEKCQEAQRVLHPEWFEDEAETPPPNTPEGMNTQHEALSVLADWPRRSTRADGSLTSDPREGLANVRRFAREAIQALDGLGR